MQRELKEAKNLNDTEKQARYDLIVDHMKTIHENEMKMEQDKNAEILRLKEEAGEKKAEFYRKLEVERSKDAEKMEQMLNKRMEAYQQAMHREPDCSIL